MKGIEEREVAEIAKFTPGELKEYEDSLKTYRDLKNSLDTAEEKGEAKEKKATIRRLLASGASVDIIAVATGLTQDEVKPLIEEITKA
ncbi:MAG: Rpn family recombination-promoting nuclease/putative transposase [Prevotella sp.]|nr:Rpn family recombination-promoting nuclease/putative transposase [Prevotella sp.]